MGAWNLYRTLGESLPGEDFLTASLASLMEGMPELKQAFVQWVGAHIHEDLTKHNWTICVQQSRPTPGFGDAILDMIFRCGGLELWFEHKLGASVGKRTSKDGLEKVNQIEKYQRARQKAERGGQRVLLFLITAKPQVLTREDVGEVHTEAGEGGYVWAGEHGYLEWADFLPRAQKVLQAHQEQAPQNLQTQLLDQFVTWWKTTPGLHWAPVPTSLFSGDPQQTRALWGLLGPWLQGNIQGGIRHFHYYGGYTPEVYTRRGDVDYLTVCPERAERIPGWDAEVDGVHVLRVSIRVVDGSVPKKPPQQWHSWGSEPSILLLRGGTNKGLTMRFHVALADWEQRRDDVSRQRGILGAVQACIHLFEKLTGVDLIGEKELHALMLKDHEG